MSRYLITGGTGLVGNYAVRELIRSGAKEEEIIVYDLYPNENIIEEIGDDITLVQGDITDRVQLMETFSEYEPERIIHLAAYVAHKAYENPTQAIEVNCIGTNNVFEAARIHEVPTCLFASSASVYGTPNDYYWIDDPIVDETDLVKPENPYTVTKYMNEVSGKNFDEKYSTNYVGVRIGGVWGRGRSLGATGQLNAFIKEIGLENTATVPPYWMMWDGINVSYGKDVGRWLIEVANKDEFSYAVYNQGNQEPYNIGRITEILQRLVPEATIEYPDLDKEEEWSSDTQTYPPLNCTRWYNDLGLSQEWSVEEAIVDYVNYHRRQHGLDEIGLP